MIQFTTPTIPMTVDADLTGNRVFVTFRQDKVAVTKEVTDFTVQGTITTLYVPLTQEETGKFDDTAVVSVQANWIDAGGIRGATAKEAIVSLENLLDEVISYNPEPDPVPDPEEDGDGDGD